MTYKALNFYKVSVVKNATKKKN